ncbi:MAG TPA: hypothetical protein VF025_05305 [Gaiellaceae bacterium]
MERPRADDAELRATVAHLASQMSDLRQEFRTDVRRLDDRIFQLMLLQIGTLATALASLAVVLVS